MSNSARNEIILNAIVGVVAVIMIGGMWYSLHLLNGAIAESIRLHTAFEQKCLSAGNHIEYDGLRDSEPKCYSGPRTELVESLYDYSGKSK